VRALGIDYGTSTTVFVAAGGERLDLLPDDSGEEVIPSVLAFTPAKHVVIGKAARSRILIDPENTLFSIKRVFGKPWNSPDVKAFRKHYPFEMESDPNGVPRFVTRLGKLTAVQAAAHFLAQARGFKSLSAEAFSPVMVAVPEAADLAQQQATTQAAQEAGFSAVEVVAEPAAAVLSYLRDEPTPRQLLVYDLGGGTFDAAVVRWDGTRATVMASAGDSYLGGDDIDHAIAGWAAESILRTYRWDVHTSVRSWRVLVFLCEQAKRNLSIAEQTSINLQPVDEVLKGRTLTLDRALLRDLLTPLIDRSLTVCANLLGSVSTKPDALDRVVLVGGSTYIPLIRDRVATHFGRPLLTALPADRVVAMGAALLAQRRARV
jgi:molecular chaperone DnaK (HSP70)